MVRLCQPLQAVLWTPHACLTRQQPQTHTHRCRGVDYETVDHQTAASPFQLQPPLTHPAAFLHTDQDAVAKAGKFGFGALALFKHVGHRVLVNAAEDLVVRPAFLEASVHRTFRASVRQVGRVVCARAHVCVLWWWCVCWGGAGEMMGWEGRRGA